MRRGEKNIISVVCGAFLALCFLVTETCLINSGEARAETGEGVIINELMWDGAEYVELFNSENEEVFLAGWRLIRQKEGGEKKEIVEFEEGDTIGPRGYYLLEDDELATEVEADKIVSSLTLLNSGELVILLDDTGETRDEANRLGMWYAGENTSEGVSMERSGEELDGTLVESWHSSTVSIGGRRGTPKEENSEAPVNTAPEAAISVSGEMKEGEVINFFGDDSSDADGDELNFSWEFGDGQSAVGDEVEHVYDAPGTYEVVLMVDDSQEEVSEAVELEIEAVVYTDTVVINEILPNPEGSDTEGEFIELKNTGSEAADLSGWQLDDQEGGSKSYTIEENTEIGAGEVMAFRRKVTKIALNNGGDAVRLLDPAGEIKSEYVYEDTVEEGVSISRGDDGGYLLSTTVTEEEENIITELETDDGEEESDEGDDEEETATEASRVAGQIFSAVVLSEIREREEGEMVKTEGVVSAPPGVLGDKIMYLAGSGVQVYFYKEEWPQIKMGDRVEVAGEVSISRGETRVKIFQKEDLRIVARESPLEPHLVDTGEVGEEWEGSLVIVQGEVARTSGDTFYVDDGSGEVKVYIKESTRIDKPSMKKGVAVTVVGVVSETSSGYRILPRFQEDVRLGRVAGLTSFPATGARYVFCWNGRIYGWLMVVLTMFIILKEARARHEPLFF